MGSGEAIEESSKPSSVERAALSRGVRGRIGSRGATGGEDSAEVGMVEGAGGGCGGDSTRSQPSNTFERAASERGAVMRLHFASVRSSAPTGDHITGDDAAAAAGVVAATLG